jgi:hypothetical protein
MVMSKLSFHTKRVVAVALALTFWVGWKGAKDWVQSSSAKNHTQLRTSNAPANLPFPSPTIRDLKPGTPSNTVKVNETYGKLPLSFEANQGQVDSRVKFLSRGKGYSLSLTSTEAVLRLAIDDCRLSTEQAERPNRDPLHKNRVFDQAHLNRQPSIDNRQLAALRMRLLGANPHPQIEGLDPLPGKSNYFVGNDPAKWHADIPTYARVKYQDVYPGVDLVYYGNQGRFEYDLVVSPGTDPNVIRLSYEGADQIKIDEAGNLLIETAGTELRQHKPAIYQETGGSRQVIVGNYALNGKNEVSFQLDSHDAAKPLIIDPVLEYSTYLGGSESDTGFGIAVDGSGSAYVVGETFSSDFPTANPLQVSKRSFSDVFVTKLNPDGSALVYSTYLGGSDNDSGISITVDSTGNAYLMGNTGSNDFPTANALQPSYGGKTDAFVAKLNTTGSMLVYSTYLGGSEFEEGHGIAVDAAGNAYLMGDTQSSNFPTMNPLQPAFAGVYDAFVAKLNPAGTALVYSTYLGGSGDEYGFGLAVDASGNAYLTGGTASIDFPTKNPFQAAKASTFPWGFDAFVAKLNPSGNALIYSTYVGGTGDEIGWSVAVNSAGEAYVTGGTTSADFPTVNPLQPAFGGSYDAFVSKLSSTGSALVFSSYLGGSSDDEGHAIALDSSGNAYVTGFTRSINFPTAHPVQPAYGGNFDAFVAKLNLSGSALVYSSYLGGSDDEDNGRAIAVDGQGNAYVAGRTSSANFPTARPFQATKAESSDAFIAKISENPALSLASITLFVPIVVSTAGLNNSFFTSELALTNRGSKDATLDFTYTAAFGSGSGVATDSLAAGQQRIYRDAIDYLRSIGMPIPTSANRGGTLAVHFSGLSSATDAGVTVRTTTAVASGHAGLAYAGIPPSVALRGTSYLCGLRQTAADRSNVAIQNTGLATDGDIVLRLTVFSGDPANPIFKVLPDLTLPPGGFTQINSVLTFGGLSLSNGYVRVERLSGKSPYYAYAVINDQANSDGSFVPPIPENAVELVEGRAMLNLHVIVETSSFSTELVLTNWSTSPSTAFFGFVSDTIQAPDSTASFTINLKPNEQLIIPNLVQYLREQGSEGIGPVGPTYAGALFATVIGGDPRGIFLGARTSAPGGGGRFGLFYSAVPYYAATMTSAWFYGLQQNADNRSNLALVNTGEIDGNPDMFKIELFDGKTGVRVNTVEGITLDAKRWFQIGTILTQYAPGVEQGYAHVVRTSGNNPFIAYAVINDGGQPGERSGDGAFIVSSP